MSKILDFIDWVIIFIKSFFTFIGQLWNIISTVTGVALTLLGSVPFIFRIFFTLFMTIAITLFIWRLIP